MSGASKIAERKQRGSGEPADENDGYAVKCVQSCLTQVCNCQSARHDPCLRTARAKQLAAENNVIRTRTVLVRPLLILDLDETVVWATDDDALANFDFRVAQYYVTKRPHLDTFLETVSNWYEMAVWTSSSDEYARQVVDHVFQKCPPLCFVWARSRCTRRIDEDTHEEYSLKNLKKVKGEGYRLERILIIDDTPQKVQKNYGNHLRLHPFEGQANDRELLDVLSFLGWLKDQENFRAIEKRAWRGQGPWSTSGGAA